MITDFLADLNWVAVVVAAAAWFAFSAVWYSIPAMSERWQKSARLNPEEGGSFAVALATSFLCYLATTVVIALIAAGIGASTFVDGVALGVTLGVGFGVASALISQVYENKGKGYWLINGLHAVFALTIASVIVTVWP